MSRLKFHYVATCARRKLSQHENALLFFFRLARVREQRNSYQTHHRTDSLPPLSFVVNAHTQAHLTACSHFCRLSPTHGRATGRVRARVVFASRADRVRDATQPFGHVVCYVYKNSCLLLSIRNKKLSRRRPVVRRHAVGGGELACCATIFLSQNIVAVEKSCAFSRYKSARVWRVSEFITHMHENVAKTHCQALYICACVFDGSAVRKTHAVQLRSNARVQVAIIFWHACRACCHYGRHESNSRAKKMSRTMYSDHINAAWASENRKVSTNMRKHKHAPFILFFF